MSSCIVGFETGLNDESRAEEKDTTAINDNQYGELYNLMVVDGNYTHKAQQVMKAFNFTDLKALKASKFDKVKAKLV